jgi:tripartite-type tricarboxylate transporter receptor subunit TctC
MKHYFRALTTPILAMALVTGNAPSALAQSEGKTPLRLVVPLSAGSTVDAVARAMSNEMAKTFGRPIVVENLAGAGGTTGTVQVVRAPKDGSTLGMISSNHVINPSIYKSVPFDALKDVTPITVIGTVPLLLVVNPSRVPAKNTKDLIALLKSKPGQFNFGSAGNGSTLHLAGELFREEAGVDIKHIPYKGTGPLVSDLLGGQVEMGFVSVTAAAPHVKSGKLVAIGVTTPQRSAVVPDVPTLAESGLPKYSFDAWIALIGPPALPPALVAKIYADTKTVLAQKEVQSALAAQGIAVIGNTPEQAVPFFKSELDKHTALVKRSGASVE